ncbi:MAG: hypothetical protein ABI742_09325 [Gemmatimonadota bacterium]
MRPISACALLSLLAGIAGSAQGQVTALVDIGVRDAPVGALGTRSLWAVAPSLHYDRANLRLDADGEYRDYGRLGRGLSGGLDGSYFVPIAGAVRGEAVATLRGAGGGPNSSAGLWNAGARLHLGGRASGLWLGSQAGGGTEGQSLQWEAAAWRRLGNLTLQLQGSQLTLVDRVLRDGVAPDTLTPRPDTLYRDQARVTTDLAAWLQWTPPRTRLALAVGRRYGITEVAGLISGAPQDGGLGQGAGQRATTSTWWLVEATYWLAPRWGLTGSAGQRPPDSQLHSPGGRFLQLAIRTALGRGSRAGHAVPGDQRSELRTRRLAGGAVELLLLARDASRVELRGDFTDWRAVELERRGGGVWRLRQAIAAGMHTLTVRYDGGPWVPPPATRVTTDEFGQETGVLVIE